MKRTIVWILRGYQLTLSPLLPPACRFYPTCSQYMVEAVERYGVPRGVWLGVKRLGRCHPFHPGGYDPVPELDQPKSHLPVQDKGDPGSTEEG